MALGARDKTYALNVPTFIHSKTHISLSKSLLPLLENVETLGLELTLGPFTTDIHL